MGRAGDWMSDILNIYILFVAASRAMDRFFMDARRKELSPLPKKQKGKIETTSKSI